MDVRVKLKTGIELKELVEKILFENEEKGCSIDELWKRLHEMVPQGQLMSRNVEEILNKLVMERKIKLWFPFATGCLVSHRTVYFLPR